MRRRAQPTDQYYHFHAHQRENCWEKEETNVQTWTQVQHSCRRQLHSKKQPKLQPPGRTAGGTISISWMCSCTSFLINLRIALPAQLQSQSVKHWWLCFCLLDGFRQPFFPLIFPFTVSMTNNGPAVKNRGRSQEFAALCEPSSPVCFWPWYMADLLGPWQLWMQEGFFKDYFCDFMCIYV